ncbi:MAG TPA: superoxide dismutase family protein [Firmicutes bacterium]|nr:superoxide dismutase family protein [Bacillota bacterium]
MTHSPVKHLHSLPVLLNKPPQAWADLRGDALHPDIYGIVLFHQTPDGVIIATDVSGLPHGQGTCSGRFFAFHIHEGSACRGSATDPFSAAGGHFNPAGCSHPYHAGDLPPLLGCGGDAMTVFLTDRFRLDEVIGRTVVIHENADDFTTQPAGNAGARIACGVIERFTISQQPQF